MKKIISLCTLCLAALSLLAQTSFEDANRAYAEGRYAEASTLYRTALVGTSGSDRLSPKSEATVYYNLGNACFKQGELAQAILNYERSLRLDPRNKDARHNLAFAQSRITDNIAEQNFFLSAWARALRNSLRTQTWLAWSVALFVLALVCVLLFLLGRVQWLRKTAFHTGWVALLFALVAGLNAASLHNRDTVRSEAVITQGVVNAKSSPDVSGTDLFTLHEGTKVNIRETLGDWANIRVANNEGWIRLAHLERI